MSCDLCSIYLNLEPNDLRNTFGFNYRYRSFSHDEISFQQINNGQKHAIGNTVIGNTTQQSEIYRSYDLWGNYFLNEKWQLFAQISFSDNYYLEEDSVIHNISGIGDLSLMLKYMLFNTRVTDSSKWAQRLIVGGGFNLPTGKYNQPYMVSPSQSNKGQVIYGAPYSELDPHLQAGTGSLDFLAYLEYQVRYQSFGFSTLSTYRYSTENSNAFRFANRFNSNNSFFALLKLKNTQLAPNAGISLESSKRDQYKNENYLNSGGTSLFLTSGLKWYTKSLALGFSYWKPLQQNLYDNQLQNDERIMSSFTYYF